MKATDQIKHAAMVKVVDALTSDPEKNIPKVMDLLDKVAPADLFPEERKSIRSSSCAQWRCRLNSESTSPARSWSTRI